MAVSGSLLAAFLDFQTGTGQARLSDPTRPLQLVNRHTYLFGRSWRNNGMPVDGGSQLSWWFIPKKAGTFEEVLPGTITTPIAPQVLQKGIVDWRFTRAHSTTTKQEILLNDRIRYGTRDARFEQFVSINAVKEIQRETDVAEGLEDQMSAVPNKLKMEGSADLGATSPYSLFAHINQDTNGLWGAGWTATAARDANGGAWTVKENVDPASAAINANMQPQLVAYNSESNGVPMNIIGGFDRLRMALQWEQPDNLKQYSSDEVLNNLMYLTSLQGRAAVMNHMRNDQDRYAMGPQDSSWPDPQHQGIPIKRWDPLETAAVYDFSSGAVCKTEGAAAGAHKKGPRVYGLNCNHFFPITHDEMIFYIDEPLRHPHIPDTYVQYESTWWNWPCKSYKHQGLLYPSGDVWTSLY